jgi:hypothetical protein
MDNKLHFYKISPFLSELYYSIIAVFLMCNVHGQGIVNFNNRNVIVTPIIDAKLYDDVMGTLIPMSGTDTSYRAGLLGGPTSATPATPITAGTLTLLASPSSGKTWVTFRTGFAEGYVAVGSDTARDSGLPYGSTGLFQVVAWHGTQTTWPDAYNAWQSGEIGLGFSAPLTLTVTTSLTDLFVPNLTGLQSFSLEVIPEPSVYCFAVLGVAFLVHTRIRDWRKQK